jgi:nicotinic acid mononucleotide adenylyltransferase/uridine phosphorylase
MEKKSRVRTAYFRPFRFVLTVVFLVGASPVFGAIAIYTGSFDPLTKVHEAIIRATAADPRVEHMYVIVNASGVKNFNTSSYQRIQIIEAALSDLRDKVEIKSVPQEGKDQFIRDLAVGHETISVLGEDSFSVLPKDLLEAPGREWLVYRRAGSQPIATEGYKNVHLKEISSAFPETSSSLARTLIGKPELNNYLSPAVLTLIQREGFYREETNPDIEVLQKLLFQASFENFKADLKSLAPQVDFSDLMAPPYKATQTPDAWAESFMSSALRATHYAGTQALSFWRSLVSISFSFPRRQPKPKVAFVHATEMTPAKASKILSKTKSTLKPVRTSDFSMDVQDYAGDRFPRPLVDFVNNHKASLYLHNTSDRDAVEFHRRQGFTQFYSFKSPDSHPDAVDLLAYSAKTGKYRFILSGFAAQDRKAQVKTHLAASGILVPVYEIEHATARPLFQLTPAGKDLRLSAEDLVVIGFKNRLSPLLPNLASWQSTQVTESGTDMTVYTKEGRRILFVKNVYGDETQILLEYLKAIGAKKIVYMGTAGGLGKTLNIGDVLLPTKIKTEGTTWSFPNSTYLLGDLSKSGASVKNNVVHGWVQTLLSETTSFLKKEQTNGVESLDIETKYLAEFLVQNPSIHGAVALVVSDLPLGTITYDQHNITIAKVNESLMKIMPEVFSVPQLPRIRTTAPAESCLQFLQAVP